MKKIAIVYASKHGQTAKIARYMEEKLQEQGYSTQLINCTVRPWTLSSFADAALLGSPVYAGKFSKHLTQWAREHEAWLAKVPVGVFTVSLNAADQRPNARPEDKRLLRELTAQLRVSPTHVASIAGALKYRSYWWPIRLMMKRIAAEAGGSTDTSRDHELTSWPRVDNFLHSFVAGRLQAPVPGHALEQVGHPAPAGGAREREARAHEGRYREEGGIHENAQQGA